MKRTILITLGLALCYSGFAQAENNNAAQNAAATSHMLAQNSTATTTPTAESIPTVDKGKVSYSIGVDLGENFKSQNIEVDPAMLEKGLRDTLAGGKLMMTKPEMTAILMAFQKQLVAKQEASVKAQGVKNEQEGNAYLANNKNKSGVTTTNSGLQYKVVNAGTGPHPSDNDVVTVDYSGQFLNGKEFDSSYKRGKPVTFAVKEVIPGWVEVIKLMQPGATFEVAIPPQLAYGDHGLGNVIGPKQTLLFKIHLISVKPAA